LPDLSNRYKSYSRERIYRMALENMLSYTSIRMLAEIDPVVREAYDLILSENSRNKIKQEKLDVQNAILQNRRLS